jgi:uncharacterized protein
MAGTFVARWLIVSGLILASLPLRAQSQATIPAMDSAVVDTTATLTPDERARIEASIAPYEARKGSQMQVLMVPSTQPESIEEYAVHAFAQWKLGRKGIDDGVLIVVARDDHRARIEVGYGLEGAIPDVAASRILQDRMLPKFHNDDYAGGIADGVDALIGLADGEPLAAPEPAKEHSAANVGHTIGVIIGITFACIVGSVFLAVPIAGAVYAWRHKRRGFWARLIGLAVLACLALGFAAFKGVALHDGWPPFAMLGYLVTTFTFASVFKQSSGGSSGSDDDFDSSRNSSSSDSSGSSSSSSSGSDDSRSGGGGSSGGGGASGSW